MFVRGGQGSQFRRFEITAVLMRARCRLVQTHRPGCSAMRRTSHPRHIPVFQIEIAGDHIAVGGTVRRAPNIGFGSRVGRTALGTPLPYRRGRPPIRCRQWARFPCRRRPTYSRRPRRREIEILFEQQRFGSSASTSSTNSAACRRHKSDRRGRESVHPPKDSSRNHCRRRPSRPSALRPSCSRNRANRRSYCCCNRVRPTSCSRPCPRRRCRCKVRIRRRPC